MKLIFFAIYCDLVAMDLTLCNFLLHASAPESTPSRLSRARVVSPPRSKIMQPMALDRGGATRECLGVGAHTPRHIAKLSGEAEHRVGTEREPLFHSWGG